MLRAPGAIQGRQLQGVSLYESAKRHSDPSPKPCSWNPAGYKKAMVRFGSNLIQSRLTRQPRHPDATSTMKYTTILLAILPALGYAQDAYGPHCSAGDASRCNKGMCVDPQAG